jgi:hypothetical protein
MPGNTRGASIASRNTSDQRIDSHWLVEALRYTFTILRTSAWIDLHDVQDMFERVHASDVSLKDPPTTCTGMCQTDSYATVNNALEDKQIIVFVHGINISPWDYESNSRTMFKRRIRWRVAIARTRG